jgi:hypothetical protein
VLVPEDGDGPGVKRQAPAGTGRQAYPVRRENAQEVPVGEHDDVSAFLFEKRTRFIGAPSDILRRLTLLDAGVPHEPVRTELAAYLPSGAAFELAVVPFAQRRQRCGSAEAREARGLACTQQR